jgi:hypothetical protein
MVVCLDELSVLLLDLLRGLVRRAEQQVLEVVVQVLASGRGYLLVSDPSVQFSDKRANRRSDRRQSIGVLHRWPRWPRAR